MKEAIGNSAIFNIIMVFVAIIIALLVGSLSYSKAFKVKNRIVDTIEKYEDGYSSSNRATINAQIDEFLGQVGYRVNRNGNNNCPVQSGASNNGYALNSSSNYQYCIYEYQSTRGYYYAVIAYMYFDFPVIRDRLVIPVRGETQVFYYTVDNHRPQ